MEPLTIALGQLGVTAASGALQEMYNNKQHKRNLDYYNIQRNDALSDYERDRFYNSPEQMMDRAKRAGLNPHFMTGSVNNMVSGQTRAASMGNAPSAYQVNNAQSYTQMKMATEQMRSLQLQNAKTIAETEQVKANTQATNLNFDVDSETLRSKRIAEINMMAQQFDSIGMDINEKRQRIENMKGQLELLAIDTLLKKGEQVYQSEFLRGRNNLQHAHIEQSKGQLSKTLADIRSINIRNEQDVKIFQFRVSQLVEQIQQTKLSNEYASYLNYATPDYLLERNRKAQFDARNSEYDYRYKSTLDPATKYFMDNYGKPIGGALFKRTALPFMRR